MFARLGPWCHDRRRLVVILWVVIVFAGNGIASGIGDAYRQDFSLEGFESTDGFNLIESKFDDGGGASQSGQIVFEAKQGVDDPAVRSAMEELFSRVSEFDEVISVQSPYGPEGAFQVSTQGQAPGTIAFADINLPEDIDFTTASDVGDKIRAVLPNVEGLRVELGGFLFAEFEQPSAELFGLAFAIVILIVAFGSVLAMGLPVGVALFGIGMGGALVILASHLMEVPDFAPFVGAMIGLGVGIDYALLVVTRYREQLHAGHDVRDSIRIAMDTAGRSVVFAGATVVISLLGMLLMGVGFVGGLGITASLTVGMTILASITLLPALLGFAGKNIERTKWRGLLAAGFVALALVGAGLQLLVLFLVGMVLALLTIVVGFFLEPLKREVQHRPPKPRRETLAYRWSRFIQHRPWTSAIGASAALILLAVPVLSLRLGFSDESNAAEDTSTKRAYNLIVEGFGKGFTGKLYLVAEVTGAEQVGSLAAVNERVAADPEVAAILGPQPNNPDAPTAVRWLVQPKGGPQDEPTTELVNRLRDDVLPPVEQAAGTQVLATGQVAGQVDMSAYMGERLPIFFGAVLTLSFLLLMLVFRSLLVPLKAVIMNLLSIGAAYGVIVAIFQWGWLKGLFGVEETVPIVSFVPMMMFAVLFGL